MYLEAYSAAAFAPPLPFGLSEAFNKNNGGSQRRPFRKLADFTSGTSSTSFLAETAGQAVPRLSEFLRMALDLSKRIQSLMIEAELDGVPFSVSSCTDFVSFLADLQPRSRPSLFLNDNGNLRALWRNNLREQVGLQFLGGSQVQFVIFKQRPGAGGMARVTGVDTSRNIIAHIRASGAQGLLLK